ncbi:TetR/AcrR family transcriptional regulator [Smaragdicoccus niigatensis]|uniref:TetR/AcrR family transcriptional regulator n=1 Tax=Smaragdicoccus niigatensis TaxID=359359 RepID=UPI000382D8F2|nr:TetR/AcrR family transcriptional regulator [Smaragdicoccus niigatensis]
MTTNGQPEAKQDRSRANRELLVDAFLELLREKHYSDISIAEVARRAGLTTGAVYARFGDKSGVAVAAHDRFAEESVRTMTAWAGQSRWETATPAAIIDSWTRGAINFARTYQPMLVLMFADPAVGQRYESLIAEPPELLSRLLSRVMPEREGFHDDVVWAGRAALVVIDRFGPDSADLAERIHTMLHKLIGVS